MRAGGGADEETRASTAQATGRACCTAARPRHPPAPHPSQTGAHAHTHLVPVAVPNHHLELLKQASPAQLLQLLPLPLGQKRRHLGSAGSHLQRAVTVAAWVQLTSGRQHEEHLPPPLRSTESRVPPCGTKDCNPASPLGVGSPPRPLPARQSGGRRHRWIAAGRHPALRLAAPPRAASCAAGRCCAAAARTAAAAVGGGAACAAEGRAAPRSPAGQPLGASQQCRRAALKRASRPLRAAEIQLSKLTLVGQRKALHSPGGTHTQEMLSSRPGGGGGGGQQ